MNRNGFLAAATALSVICLAALGCDGGGSRGRVTGKVTLDGKPLPNAAVTFMPAEGGASSGVTDAEGNYELGHFDGKGAVIGKHKVAVTTVQQASAAAAPSLSADSPEYAKQASGGSSADYANAKKFVEPIPEKYNVKTELEHEVKSGSQVINLDLKSS